nr:RNA-directed DNA polymerase, eukaryota, reverse transcriptase zinc-binding domain protein [Tanacetum cinerariifolium]
MPVMGSYKSKEDDVAKISLSVYITNFPDSCSAKDLFHSCKQYGHVVDSFIPNKRSKAGKRFGFVRFINVFNEERLVNNLCTVWIGRYRLHANLARFQRTSVSGVKNLVKDEGGKKGSSNHMNKKVNEDNWGGETELFPAVVLDDECLVTKDLSKSLLGGVKEFACLANLKVALCTEGFVDIKIHYMGELWVMLEFGTQELIKLFRDNVSVGSWFSCIKQASMDFVTEGRIAWVEIEGIPFKLWSNNTFKRIANRWGVLLDIDDQEETCYHSKRICIHMKSGRSILENFKIIHRGKVYWVRASETPSWVPDFIDEYDDEDQKDDTSKDGGFNDHDSGSGGGESAMEEVPETLFEDDGLVKNDMEEGGMDEQENKSEDPFKFYPLLEKKNNSATKNNICVGSLKYPPGFTPRESFDVDSMHVEGDRNVNVEEVRANSVGVVNDGSSGNRFNKNSKEDSVESVVSGHFKKSTIRRTGGSILGILDDMVKVGQVMGYNMDRCKSNMADIIGSQGVEESDSVGNSRGILCVWDTNSFVKHNVTILDYFFMVRGVWRSTGQLVLLITIYAPHDVSEKQMLWDFLQWEISKWTGDVVIMGDFNEVSYKSDRFGSVFNAYGASLFNSFIRSSGLVEVNLGGSSFTWCHKSAIKMSKLDRFLVFESFLNTCPNVNAITLERYLSNHRPILLRESHVDYGPTPFRFFHYWLEMEGFCKVVEDGCKESPCDSSNAMRNLLGKLKHLKKVIRVWKKTNTINVNNIKAQHKIALEAVDSCIDKGNGTKEDVKRRVEILNKIQDIGKLKSLEMAQKAKVKWAVEGDENSNQQRDCGTDKAPGLDGFTFGFYRRFWYLIDNDVYDVMRYFFIYDDILEGCNSSFIELIPKIPDVNMVKDFRPISLVGSLYKIIAKILANRLVGVLGVIISEVQSAFIADRHILDGPFILNEVLQWCKVKKKQALIFKIQSCLKSLRGSIIINGSPTEEFQFGKGLKQGDPLSPFLFILIMESLHLSFQRVVDAGMFHGLQLCGLVNLSHMFYADDAVFVGQWSESNINSLVHVLECFNLVSGLKINMRKSKIMGVNVNRDKVNRAAMKLGCLVLKAPFLYLGSMVGGAMSKANAWSEVVDRVKNRLSKWKMKTLSIGGRLTLRKSVLGSMSIFHMSMFKVPSGVLRSLESLRSHFFNGHDTNSRKASYVKWKTVLASKERGGLDVSSLYALNRGLLFKWIWRRTGKRSCWLNIIHEVKALLNMGIDLKKYMRIKLGDGENTAFWEDNWSEGGKLKYKYPRLYSLELCKSIYVGSKLVQSSLTDSFRRIPIGGAEQQQFNEMVDLVNSISIAPMSDRLVWELESSGEFTVSSVRKLIYDIWLPRSECKTRLIKYVPIKINVHAWKVMSDSIPTRFNISRRGICIDSIRCVFCDKGVETSNQLFFSCCLVRQVSRLIMRWWDVPEAEFESYEGWLSWLVNLRLPHKNKLLLEGVFYVMWWLIWIFRNKTIFETKHRSKEDQVSNISKSVFVTNFSDNFGSRDLWRLCESYGKVVYVFIPYRLSKAGKRFAFVRFIRVSDMDRLIGNLCTLWVNRYHLHANAVRYERPSKASFPVKNTFTNPPKQSGSFVNVVKGDLSLHVMRKVKDPCSIPHLYSTLLNEGFSDVILSYLGGAWVLVEMDSLESKSKLLLHIGVRSWFEILQDATHDFVSEDRIVWVDFEGISLNLWSRETFVKIGKKWGELLDIEENSCSSFAHKRVCIRTKQVESILESFKFIFKGKVIESDEERVAKSSFIAFVAD